MSNLILIIGNKKYSSWSLRPWLALKVKEIEFDEELSPFDHATNHAHFWEFSPTKKVPVLVHDGQTIWDSLAILEFVAELYPDKGLWPTNPKQRAHARAVSSEMHSGFMALREECPMNMNRSPSALALTKKAQTDIQRIETMWSDCLDKSGGPFLFGDFTIADAMFAPVVNRFQVYAIQSDAPAVDQYCGAICAVPAWREWQTAGQAESWVCDVVEF